jgi:hypothetical protein
LAGSVDGKSAQEKAAVLLFKAVSATSKFYVASATICVFDRLPVAKSLRK